MKPVKKLALLLIAFLISGCSFIGTDIDGVLLPPKPAGEQAEIKTALEEAVGKNIILKYPLSGEYRSAFVLRDIDNDGQREVFAFYRLRSEGAGLHVNVLCCEKSNWRSVYDYTSSYNDVDSIHFVDLDKDGIEEILIGWSAYNTKVLSIFSLKDRRLVLRNAYENEDAVDSYTQYKIADYDADGMEEVMFLLLNSSAKTAGAKAISLTEERVLQKGSVTLNGNVSSWAQVRLGTVFDNRPCVFLDGYIEKDQLITELIFWDKGTLSAPFSNLAEEEYPPTLRETPILSMDIDGDGTVEIPIPKILPGYENSLPEEKKHRADWYRYDGEKLTKVMSGILNARENYFFRLPWPLEDRVTIESHAANRTMVFYLYRPNRVGSTRLGDPFMRIGVFTQAEWKELAEFLNYEIITTKGDLVYAAEFLSAAQEAGMDLKTAKELFSFLPSTP